MVAAGSLNDRVNAPENTVIQYASRRTPLAAIGIATAEWFGNITETLARIHLVERNLAAQVLYRAARPASRRSPQVRFLL